MAGHSQIPDWHPAKAGVWHRGTLIEFARECDSMTMPDLIAHYRDVVATLDAARLAYIGDTDAVARIDESAATVRNALRELHMAYTAVRFSFGRSGARWLGTRYGQCRYCAAGIRLLDEAGAREVNDAHPADADGVPVAMAGDWVSGRAAVKCPEIDGGHEPDSDETEESRA